MSSIFSWVLRRLCFSHYHLFKKLSALYVFYVFNLNNELLLYCNKNSCVSLSKSSIEIGVSLVRPTLPIYFKLTEINISTKMSQQLNFSKKITFLRFFCACVNHYFILPHYRARTCHYIVNHYV